MHVLENLGRRVKTFTLTASCNIGLLRSISCLTADATLQYGFSKDICRSMIAMMDVDRSGKLGLEEFKKLWCDVKSWQVSSCICYHFYELKKKKF